MADKPKKEEYDLDSLSEMSGETSVRQTRYEVPILKFNGSEGKFYIRKQNEKKEITNTEVGVTVSGVILKIRRTLVSFETAGDTDISMFSNEHNSFVDDISLFERRGTNKPKLVFSGKENKAREMFPVLRLKQYLYLLYDKDVVKLGVKGKSLSSLYNYYGEFTPSEHLFQYITDITCYQETNKGRMTYYVMKFNKGKPSDLKDVSVKIKEVATAISLQDKSFKEAPKMEETAETIKKDIPKEDIPVFKQDEEEDNGPEETKVT